MNTLELNVSTEFTVPCYIKEQSSSESKFQVTWFRQKDKESKQQPLFTFYQNSTLRNRFEEYQLRFERPLTNNFSLTVLESSSDQTGLYFCEVEEWVPSLSHRWRKVAVEKSKYMTVNVLRNGKHNFILLTHFF